MGKEIGIVDLLKPLGFDEQLKTKLVRHQANRLDVTQLIRENWFELYQSLQVRPIFDGIEQIISFVGAGSQRAKFVGVYRILDHSTYPKSFIPASCPYDEWRNSAKHYYHLERQPEYALLENRVIIDWGGGALAWHQYLKNKPVVEILPPGRALPPFQDYLGFTLSHTELKHLVANPHAHSDWVSGLSAVKGVYLILAQSIHQQYVGAACGDEGMWGRWCQYAANGHGGNKALRELIEKDITYPNNFYYTILQVLPQSTTNQTVFDWESLYKQKLGSRVIGLNMN